MPNLRVFIRRHFVVVLGVICVVSAVGVAGYVLCGGSLRVLDWLSLDDTNVIVERRIAELSQVRECMPRQVAYLREIYFGGNGEYSLLVGGDVWALFLNQPQMISRVNAADHRGGFARMVLKDGFQCYHEYHRRIGDDLVEKADVLYHGEIERYMPSPNGLRGAWDAFRVRLRPSGEPGYSTIW